MGGFIGSAYELTGAGAPFKARAERVTSSLFPLLGIEPLLGRVFTQQEDDNASPVTVISYALWKERFHSDPNVLGTTIDLDRRPYTIIGVMPRSFEFPLDAGRLSHRDLWVPMSFTPVEKKSEGNNFDYSAVARLKPGVTMPQAQQDVDRITAGNSGPISGRKWSEASRLFSSSSRGSDPQCAASSAHPARRGRPDPADRLRQSGKPAAGEGCWAQTRIWSTSGAGCCPKNDVPAIVDREPGVELS